MSSSGNTGGNAGENGGSGGNQPPRMTNEDATRASEGTVTAVESQQAPAPTPAPAPTAPDMAAVLARLERLEAENQELRRAAHAAQQAAPAPTAAPFPDAAPPAQSRGNRGGQRGERGQHRGQHGTTEHSHGQQRGGHHHHQDGRDESKKSRRQRKREARSAASVSAPSVPAASAPVASIPAPSLPTPSLPAPSLPVPSLSTPSLPAYPFTADSAVAREVDRQVALNIEWASQMQRLNMSNQMIQNVARMSPGPFPTPPAFSLAPLPTYEVFANNAESQRLTREATLAQQGHEALMADFRRRDLNSQVAGAVTLRDQLWGPLFREADRVIGHNSEQLRILEQTPFQYFSEAALFYRAVINGATQHRRNLDDDCARIRGEIESWTVGSHDVAATIEADFRSQARKREMELTSLVNDAARQRNSNEGPAAAATQQDANQFPPLTFNFINVNVNGPQNVARPTAQAFPALPAGRRVTELIDNVDTAEGGSNAEEDGSTAIVRSEPTHEDDRDLYD